MLEKIAKKYKLGLISNIDDKLLGQTRRHIPLDFDLVVTAQQVRSYKPDPAHFTECERRIGGKKGWVHVAASYYHDVEPCLKKKIPVIWVNRNKQPLEPARRSPTPRSRTCARRRSCSASAERRSPRRCGSMRVVAPTRRDRVRQPRLADDLHGRARRRRGVRDRLAGLPGRARGCCRRCSSRPASRLAGCSPRTATGTTCSAGSPSPAPSLGVRRDDRRAAGRRARARRSASCATSTSEHYVERRAPLRARPRPVAAGARRLRARRRARARAAPRRRAHRRRHRVLAAVAAGARLRRLPLTGRDPELRRTARSTPIWRRSRGCEPLVDQAEHVVPATAAPIDRRDARGASWPRIAPTWRRCRDAASAPLPRRAATATQRRLHEANVARAAHGAEARSHAARGRGRAPAPEVPCDLAERARSRATRRARSRPLLCSLVSSSIRRAPRGAVRVAARRRPARAPTPAARARAAST